MKSGNKRVSIFSRITSVTISKELVVDPQTGRCPAFEIWFCADGIVPFPQVIVREHGREHIYSGGAINIDKASAHFTVTVPAGTLPAGNFQVQVEGCRRADWQNAGGGDWVKAFAEVNIAPQKPSEKKSRAVKAGASKGVKIYFGIHKHMHQPYYRAADTNYWDGEKDGIFGSRAGNYTQFLKDAVDQYISGQLPRGGLSTSWSGSLIEQLNRCAAEGLCGGAFGSWTNPLREAAPHTTNGKAGAKRMAFTDFGFFHPLMALIPGRDIVTQIEMHRKIIRDVFGVETSRTLFPPETAFHVRMIPWLNKAGVKAVIYDSVHRYRACKDYPYGGKEEGMLPPNQSEQENAGIGGWMRLTNIWAPSQINTSMLRPEYIKYEDVDGTVHKIIGIPAERYLGNEDARGGYGALQYGSVLGQIYDHIVQTDTFDPAHPPFFLLHSDGDNHGGGADSYYRSNTGQLVEWLKNDSRFELCTVDDYLNDFPPDPKNAVHVEPGSWAGADNGDPQFRKWFSMYEQPYSPDLNSWAVLTALQNCIYTVQDSGCKGSDINHAVRLLLTAETSCYWYWTGQDIWDRQVTDAANAAMAIIRPQLDKVISAGSDKTGPVIFPPWVTPENPGGKTWGNNCLRDAEKEGTVHTFIYDVSGLSSATLVIRAGGKEQRITMKGGTYPSKTSPAVTGEYYTAKLPQGLGDVRYYIEAEDKKKNVSVSSLERIFLA
ncbi:MAG: glycosyl hydrolase family 57 [Chitinispirillia bacterium]|nr:glycosyl hydrolase family 57 [Chitinispirillia bacterium]